MNNSLQLGFVSILLALVMYFAVLSFQKDPSGFEIDTSSRCPAMCCLTRCETHKVEVVNAQTVRFAGGLYSPEAFGEHLVHAHQKCPLARVHIWAAAGVRHDIVFDITNRVLKVSPNSEIFWGNIDS